MPIVRIEMWEGRTVDQKRELVEVITAELSRIVDCDPSSIYVVIDDVSKDNWGAGGVLSSDKYP